MSGECYKKNKEVLDEIEAYLITKNPVEVSRLAANLMLDIHRFVNMETLPEAEAKSLIERSLLYSQEFSDFAKGKRRESFKLIKRET